MAVATRDPAAAPFVTGIRGPSGNHPRHARPELGGRGRRPLHCARRHDLWLCRLVHPAEALPRADRGAVLPAGAGHRNDFSGAAPGRNVRPHAAPWHGADHGGPRRPGGASPRRGVAAPRLTASPAGDKTVTFARYGGGRGMTCITSGVT